jgi:hypothetical protein
MQKKRFVKFSSSKMKRFPAKAIFVKQSLFRDSADVLRDWYSMDGWRDSCFMGNPQNQYSADGLCGPALDKRLAEWVLRCWPVWPGIPRRAGKIAIP